MNFCPAGACAAGGGSEPALSVLMHDSLSREKEQSVPLFKMHRTDRTKTKVFFFFFFSESKKLLQLPHCQKYQKVTSMSHVTLGEDGG